MTKPTHPCAGCGADVVGRADKLYCGPSCRPRCAVDECEKPKHGLAYCSAHHTRWKRYGDPLAPKVRLPNMGQCSVEGCAEPMRKRDWCAKHYAMWHKYGEIRDWNYHWGEGGYNPAHRSLQRLRGKAAEHSCVDCGDAAEEWSYNGSDPGEITDSQGRKFTRNPGAYSPRCVACHRRFDDNPIAMRHATP